MNDQENTQENNSSEKETTDGNSSEVNIQPSEPEAGASDQAEENAPGRTPGKAEGSRETVEADLEDKDKEN